MGRQEHRGTSGGDLADEELELMLQQRVEARGWLVEDQQLGPVGERLDDPDLAPVAGAQLADRPGRVELEAAEQAGDRGGIVATAEGAVEGDHVGGRVPRVEVEVTGQVADPSPDGRIGPGAAEHRQGAGRGAHEVEQHADRRGLARAVGPEVAEHLAVAHLEVEAVDRVRGPEPLGHAPDLDGRSNGHRGNVPAPPQ
jgi:hypothetical protein